MDLSDSPIIDPRWRLNHLYRINTKSGDLITFKENSIQRYLNDNCSNRYDILKARQFGITTNEVLKALDFAIFNKNKTVCILAHEQDAIKKIFSIVRRAIKFMDQNFAPVVDKGGGSQYEIRFPEINSKIYCDLEVRGDTIHYLHVSEVAFIKERERIDATLQAVPLDCHVSRETTPNGLGDFYDDWINKNSIYQKFFFPWYMHDEYKIKIDSIVYTDEEKKLISKAKSIYGIKITKEQINFRRFKKSEIKKMFIQEYPEDDVSCFLMSGNNVLDLENINRIKAEFKEPIDIIDGIEIYEHMESSLYVIGADTAEGVGGDYSVCTCYNVNTREQAAAFRGQLKPSDFARKIKQMADLFTKNGQEPPLTAVERNNHGHAVLLELDEHIEYSNLYTTKDGRVGWVTDRVTRPIMVDAFVESVDNNTIAIKQHELLNECLTLISDKGKIQAADGKHDDCVIASCIALQMVIEESSSLSYNKLNSMIRV